MDLIPGFDLPTLNPPVVDPKNELDQWFFLLLTAIIGIGWIIAYAGIIRRGQKDHHIGMPMVALSVNIAWEFIFAFVFPHPTEQKYVNAIWFVMDCFIAWQVWKWGARDFRRITQRQFRAIFLGLIAYAFAMILVVSWETGDYDGGYTANFANILLSGLFIWTLLRRDSVVGQSFWIAVGKLVGSLGAGVLFLCWYPGRPAFYLFTLTIFTLDCVYVYLYVRVARRDGVPLLSRF